MAILHQKSKIELEEKLDELCHNLKISNDQKFYTIGEMKVKNIGLKDKLANKLEVRVQQVQEARNKTFRSSGGSRRVRGDEYIPRKNCQCCPNRIRPCFVFNQIFDLNLILFNLI